MLRRSLRKVGHLWQMFGLRVFQHEEARQKSTNPGAEGMRLAGGEVGYLNSVGSHVPDSCIRGSLSDPLFVRAYSTGFRIRLGDIHSS